MRYPRIIAPFAIAFAIVALASGVHLTEHAFAHGDAEHRHQAALLIIDADSFLVNAAVKSLDVPEGITVRFFTRQDLANDDARHFIVESDVVIIDVMGPELTKWLTAHVDPEVKRVYALRGGREDDALRRRGFIFDETVKRYFDHLSEANIRNMIYRVIHKDIDSSVNYDPVVPRPERGVYHPDADAVFPTAEAFLEWRRARAGFEAANPWIGIMFFSSNLIAGQRKPYDFIIRRLEDEGFNVMACFGRDREVVETLLLDEKRHARVDLVLAFALKFYSAMDDDLRRALADLDVPVLNAVNLYSLAIDDWRNDPVGIQPIEVVWTVAVPEMSGAAEPTPLSGKVEVHDAETGKTVYMYYPIEETVERIIARVKGWTALRRTPNARKRLAVLYYNHSQGKQNVGASYLNVFRSLEVLLDRLGKEGYQVGDGPGMSEDDLRETILRSGRNIGAWAPGELARMLAEGEAARIPLATYAEWFDALPESFRQAVLAQWGPPEASDIMVKDGHIIIPAVIRGNLVLMPEPARGWADAPMKLYHDATLFPHHQYIAAYLWLKRGFAADAMIHLGTHATHEWLPGKQAGLAPSDSPEVLITDLPNIYPYIVDNIGEGLQAKRRGRGVVIDHLIPPLRPSGLYHEYADLLEMINAYRQAAAMDGETAAAHLDRIRERVRETGIDMDLHTAGDHAHPEPAGHAHGASGHRHRGEDGRLTVDDALVHDLAHYLQEIKTTLMPYGMHTFGRSPAGTPLADMAAAVAAPYPERAPDAVAQMLRASGPREMDHLVHALAGGYVSPAEGNDPIRNINAIPTGNNFYGFSPDKVPSRAAWEMGKQTARQIIDRHLAAHGGYPQKTAIVLWATETIRNEGVNESAILYLMGMTPQWDRTDRVTGTRVIPGDRLNRPRIDVLVNPSGLYRDLFPHMIRFIDDAIQTAAVQTDIENLIAANTARIEQRLLAQGLSEEVAGKMAGARIFGETPGSYGTGVSEMTSASGYWESDADVAAVYRKHVGFAFGKEMWGQPARTVFRQNLKDVDVVMHSRSSQLYGLLDNDDVFGYLGGLSMAVAKERGRVPDTLITDQRTPGRATVEDVARTLGREMRARYFNPQWIQGMKKENYAGAREMAKFMDYLWGWQVTTPTAVDAAKWEQANAVYVEDKYGLDLKAFFNRENPWAYQSMTARMLEAVRKGYWNAEDATEKKLAAEYALNVVDKGVACCDHTCNNPLLNQMVVNIISLPGVLSPELVERFKLAVEQMAKKPLADQTADRKALMERLQRSVDAATAKAPSRTEAAARQAEAGPADPDGPAGEAAEPIEGYKMERMDRKDEATELTSSGVQWAASLFILMIVGVFVFGLRRKR